MGGGYTPTFGGTSAASPYAAGTAAVLQSAATALLGSPFSLPTWARSSQARAIILPM
jgi:subtilisin family serine protease